MKEEKAHFIGPSNLAKEAFVENENEQFDQKEIDKIANEIASMLEDAISKNTDPKEAIIHVIDEYSLGKIGKREIYDDDIREGIYRIRKAVADSLEHHPKFEELKDKVKWDMILRSLVQDGIRQVIGILKSNKVLKDSPIFDMFDPTMTKAHNKALHKLYELDEKCPYLAYPIEKIANVGDLNSFEIQTYMNMVTLEDLLNLASEQQPSKYKLLSYLLDAMRGLQFLLDNGLVLSDFRLKNIGVNLDTDKGMLFDFDSLYQKGDKAIYLSHPDQRPEEVDGQDIIEFKESYMVHELGVTILQMWEQVEFEGLKTFAEKMSSEDPDERPQLDECIKKIETMVN